MKGKGSWRACGTYAMIAIPHSPALQWFIYGVVTYVIAGIAYHERQ